MKRSDRATGVLIVQAATIVALIVGFAVIMLTVGRPHFVLVHIFYFPIILAAYWFRSAGGMAAGLAAGLATSPAFLAGATPSDYASGSWIIRVVFLTGFGAFGGAVSEALARRLRYAEGMVRDLTGTYARTLRSLMRLLEHHDEETSRHCERVARNALAVGRSLGMPPGDLEALYWAGYMHDVGKLATPARILLKAGALTDDEYRVVKEHAAIGADTVAEIAPAFLAISEGIRSHHERWDGKGYPRGLKGEEIPSMGRILAVVDAFEAMTSDRPYRGAMEAQEAQLLIQAEAGRQFDAAVVDRFVALLGEGAIHLERAQGKHTSIGAPVEFSPEFLTEPLRQVS